MPSRRTLTLTPQQRKELVEVRDHDRRPDMRERAAGLVKIADGKSPYWVAREGLLKPHHPDTVYRWMDWYEKGGIDGLEKHRYGGPGRRPFRFRATDAGGSRGATATRPR